MILANVVVTSITLAGTVLLAKAQGYFEPDQKKKESEKSC